MFNVIYMIDAPYAGGAERYISLVARSLDRSLFTPVVLAREGGGLTEWVKELEDFGIAVVRAPMQLPFRPWQACHLIDLLRSLSPHIVHINVPGPYDGQMGLLAPLARVGSANWVVVTEHLPMVEKLWKRALLKQFSYRWVDRVLTVCEANRPYLIEQQGVASEKIEVIHNALPDGYGSYEPGYRDMVRGELVLDKDRVAICIVGSLIARKGHAVLLESLAPLRDLSWSLFIIGEGEDRSSIEAQVKRLALDQHIRFLGSLTAADVEKFFAAMDVLALPSRVEAFPYVVLEAMACSLPVVASRVFGIPEAALDEETALLVEPDDVDGFSKAFSRLIRDEKLRKQLGVSGRRRFENRFTLDKQLSRIHSLYLDALGRP